MNGKGSVRRPAQVSSEVVDANWERVFGKKRLAGKSDMLQCPECYTPAIPPSGFSRGLPTWTEKDPEVRCPGCGCLLYVFLTGDGTRDWCEARISETEDGGGQEAGD